jgi:Aspartyl protease
MKFAYKKLGARILRPVIPIDLVAGEEVVRYEVLVDSGADCNVVPAEIGELLGIDVGSGRRSDVGGITGGGMPFFVHTVTMRVGGWEYEVPVGFLPSMPALGYGVVGQRGFFDLFKVTFDRRRGEIELKPYQGQ